GLRSSCCDGSNNSQQAKSLLSHHFVDLPPLLYSELWTPFHVREHPDALPVQAWSCLCQGTWDLMAFRHVVPLSKHVPLALTSESGTFPPGNVLISGFTSDFQPGYLALQRHAGETCLL
ncbi:hypothetical protein CLAIMM_01335 isoform 1, partial [Cladophialophora immunda]